MEGAPKYEVKTEKEYFEDSYRFTSKNKVADTFAPGAENNGDFHTVVLEKTIFHPQGGGQPSDKGYLEADGLKFEVTKIRLKDDAILLDGKYDGEKTFEKGQEVEEHVNEAYRRQNARLHSAGHLLDMAMIRAGRNQLKPGKGYHFEEGPYVEYIGVVPEKEREELIQILNKNCADIIQESKDAQDKVFMKVCPYDEASELLKGIGGCPAYIPQGSDVRVLKLTPQDFGCPCGGTHVQSVADIGSVEVVRIKKKKQNTQVSYRVTPPA